MDVDQAAEVPSRQPRSLSTSERLSIVDYLLSVSANGAIASGHAAIRFSRSRRSIRLLWRRYTVCQTNEERMTVLTRFSSLGGWSQGDRAAVRDRIRQIDMQDRMNMRSLATSAGTTLYMVQRLVAEQLVPRRTTRLYPLLNADQDHTRLRWILSWLQNAGGGGFGFANMNNFVHVDEKFDEDCDHKSYYILEDETAPHRIQRSERFVDRIMFLATVARPQIFPNLYY